ncbi:MAG: four helix bundle protein [Saprospiraceae bacterium]
MDSKSKKISAFEIEARLINFSVRVIKMAETLPKEMAARHLASQIIRSATSPALNYGEAQNAESIDDFLHKMKICLKELRETFISGIKLLKRFYICPLVSQIDLKTLRPLL